MFERTSDLLKLYKQGNGSMLFSINDMLHKADLHGLTDVEARAFAAKELALVVQRLEFDWSQLQQSGPPTRPDAAKTDVRVDRTISQIHTIVKTYTKAEKDSLRRQAARRIVQGVFPRGVGMITSLPYERQFRATKELTTRLKGEFAADIETVGVTMLVDDLVSLNKLFGEQLSVHDDRLTFNTLSAARNEADEAYSNLLLTALVATIDKPDIRQTLFSGIEDQQARIARYMRRRGTAPRMDPETGDIVDENPEPGNNHGNLDVDPMADL